MWIHSHDWGIACMGWMTINHSHIKLVRHTIGYPEYTHYCWLNSSMVGASMQPDHGSSSVAGRNPALPWMVETLQNPVNNGINHLSTGAGILPSAQDVCPVPS